MKLRRLALCVSWFFLVIVPPLFAEVPWWDKAWKCRRVVRTAVTSVREAYSPQAAEVTFSNNGYIKEDASDVRVVDNQNRLVPYRIIYSRPHGSTTIAFKSDALGGEYYIYSGNPRAGKLRYNWNFQGGLLLETRKKGPGNAHNWPQMKKLLENSKEVYGRGFQPQIFHGYNPYGPDDNYVSIYKGYIYCPEKGTYGFATVSDDASFLFIDGKMVAQWPGYHGADGGRRAQHRGEIQLKKGIYEIEYYHMEGGGAQVCEAAWKKPSDKQYEVIPTHAYLPLLKGKVGGYEKQNNPYPADFFLTQEDNLWFDNQTLTRVKFYENSGDKGSGGECTWNFGDGIMVAGTSSPTHIYLKPGEYRITLKVTVPVFLYNYEGSRVVVSTKEAGFLPKKDMVGTDRLTDTCQRIIRVDEVVPTAEQQDFNQMRQAYQRILATYELDQLSPESLSTLLKYYQFTEDLPSQAKVYTALLRKKLSSSSWYKYSLKLAEVYEQNGNYKEAVTVYDGIIKEGKNKSWVADASLKKARIYLDALDRLREAEAILLKLIKDPDLRGKESEQLAYLALGDIGKKRGEIETARKYYELAQKEDTSLLREGMYLQRIEAFIRNKEYNRALEELEELEKSYPRYRLGYGVYLRALCLYHEGKKREALKELEFLQEHQKEAVYSGKVDALAELIGKN